MRDPHVRRSIAGALALLAATASVAGCPDAELLGREFGVSEVGLAKDLPQGSAPNLKGGGDWRHIDLGGAVPLMSDRISYAVVVDLRTRLAWIHASGGIAGVSQWYGPAPAPDFDFGACAIAERNAFKSGPSRP